MQPASSSDLPLPPHARCGIGIDDRRLGIGAGARLVRMDNGRLAVEADAARFLALLSVLRGRPVSAEVLRPMEAAAAYWAAGDKALANLRLVFFGLPALGSAADAARVDAAAWCLDQGLTPRELMKALDLDPSVLDLRKYDPEQPRVPAGSGCESGRWTADDGESGSQAEGRFASASLPKPVRVAANGPFKPEGIEAIPSESVDPLDPGNLNKAPPSSGEQQAIADTLNIIKNGSVDDIKKLQPHNYRNLPNFMTGAVLPPDPQGYKADVRSNASAARGLGRLVISNSGEKAYYTPNHYFSFYAVDINK